MHAVFTPESCLPHPVPSGPSYLPIPAGQNGIFRPPLLGRALILHPWVVTSSADRACLAGFGLSRQVRPASLHHDSLIESCRPYRFVRSS